MHFFAKQNVAAKETNIHMIKQNIEKATKRIANLDKLIERIYENTILGNLSEDRSRRMSQSDESEQKELLAAVEREEQALRKAEQEKVDLRVFLEMIRKCSKLKELTPTIVNTLIKRIEVHNSAKDDNSRKHVPIDIYFTAVGIINIPTENEIDQAMEEIISQAKESA